MTRLRRLLAASVLLAAAAWVAGTQWVAETQLPRLEQALSPRVEAREGRLLRAYTIEDGRWRLPLRADAVDPGYLRQLIAYEDKRFYSHPGVDPLAALRAMGQVIWHGRVVSGASTLTMQVARMLEDAPTGSWRAKLRQLRVALALERKLTKDQILTLYLQRAPMGGNIEGVRAATLSYFGKEPFRLTEAEAALLVALPQSPERRRPDRFAGRAEAARNQVLDRVQAAGVLSADAALAARREPVPSTRSAFPQRAAHLADRLILRRDGNGHAVRTTIDLDLQVALETRLRDAASRWPEPISAAALVLNHTTGAIVAIAGSPDANDASRDGAIDMTRALRSPGSALKPLIFGMAFEDGLAHPETAIHDAPMRFGAYAPQNFDGRYLGTMTLRHALQSSRNVPAVALLSDVGPARLMARMQRVGVGPVLPGNAAPGLAIGLGGVGVRLWELAALYAGIANGGVVPEVSSTAPQSEGRRLLSPRAAWYVADILSGTPPPPGAPERALAYKTGTSYGHRDAWSVGFDGRHVVAVWVGRADGAAMPDALARDLAAPLMFDLHALIPGGPVPLPPPPADALTLAQAELPQALRLYRGQNTVDRKGPRILHPPQSARLALGDAPMLALKVGEGRAPFTWLVNGAPAEVRSYDRLSLVSSPGPGFARISVIDAAGLSQSVEIEILP